MFGEPCNRDSAERVAATAAISAYVGTIVEHAFPGAEREALSTAIWALVHDLAFLHLDGNSTFPIRVTSPDGYAHRSTR